MSWVLVQIWWQYDNFNTFDKMLSKYWHGLMTPMGQQEPALRFNIIYHAHKEDIQWFRGNWYGFVIAFVMSFGSDLMTSSNSFQPTAVQILMALPDTNEPAGASTTLQHHLSDPYRGYSMFWRQLIWFCDYLCHEFWFRFDDNDEF
jgi:hypothetical protein